MRTPVSTSKIITPNAVTAASANSDRLSRHNSLKPATSMMAMAAARITDPRAAWGKLASTGRKNSRVAATKRAATTPVSWE
jgi:hypothetical protein